MSTNRYFPSVRRRMVRWGFLIIATYVLVVMLFTLLQRSLIYHPHPVPALPANRVAVNESRVDDVVARTEDGLNLHGWYFSPAGSTADPPKLDPARPPRSTDRWLVLYFSGNAGHRGYRVEEAILFNQLGCDVLLFDYRGYGDNIGVPGEPAFAADARTCWNYATQDCGIPPARVLVCGESLGGGVAVRLVSELCQEGITPGGLILRATFPSLVEVAGWHYPWLPVQWAMVDRYPSVERIPQVNCPILQFHGDRDTIVPVEMGRKLFAAAPDAATSGVSKRFVTLAGTDHNDILERSGDLVATSLQDWLQTIATTSH